MTKLQGLLKYAEFKQMGIVEAYECDGLIHLYANQPFIIVEVRQLKKSFANEIFAYQHKTNFKNNLNRDLWKLGEWYKKIRGEWHQMTIDVKAEKIQL